eukprot:10597216-Prorocentrum_lima.AAC.1
MSVSSWRIKPKNPSIWQPHLPNYPVHEHVEKVRLRYLLTDLAPEGIGAAPAGRLKGGAYRVGMK